MDRIVQCTQPAGDVEMRGIMAEENAVGKLYVRGYTQQGRALLYMRGDLEQTHHQLNNMRHLVWNLEKAIACTKRKSQTIAGVSKMGLEKIVLIQDFTNFSLAKAPPLSVSQHTLHILQSHYPERVHKIVCFNAPFMFKAFWAMVKPFVDATTKQKIVFCCTESASSMAAFYEMFDSRDELEQVTGGTALKELLPWDSAVYLDLPFDVAFDEKSLNFRSDCCY